MTDWPRIRSRTTTTVSPWMEIVAREVEFTEGAPPEIYHAVQQADYIAILARTPDGRFPIVRQYRPAIEGLSWELPAGMVDAGEPPDQTCRRELMEETGHPALAVHALGVNAPCTARLSNRVHSFFVEAGDRSPGAATEAGIETRLVTAGELSDLIRSGAFTLHLHIATIMLAGMRGLVDIADFLRPKAKSRP